MRWKLLQKNQNIEPPKWRRASKRIKKWKLGKINGKGSISVTARYQGRLDIGDYSISVTAGYRRLGLLDIMDGSTSMMVRYQ
jgi:hypothetical protein